LIIGIVALLSISVIVLMYPGEHSQEFYAIEQVTVPEQSKHLTLDSIECMALNIYHEARNQTLGGRLAVGYVTLNRVESNKYPDTVCGVVKQSRYNKWFLAKHNKKVPQRNKCSFSWYCDGKSDQPLESNAWEEAYLLAIHVINMYDTISDPTKGSIMYHSNKVKPYWTDAYKHFVTIDDHIFYGSVK